MCAFFAILFLLLGPRAGVVVWWLLDSYRLLAPFGNMTPVPILGALFFPATTLAYVAVWNPSTGPWGFDLVWLGLGLAYDVAQYVAFYYNSVLIEAVAGQYYEPKH